MKKVLSFILAAVMLVSVLCVFTFAADEETDIMFSVKGAGGEPGAGGAPGLGMENIVLGRVTDVTEGTVTLALLEPANLPEDAEASAETKEAAESAAPEFVFTVDALEETGETAEYTLEELSAAVEGEAEIAEDAILQLTLDEDGAIASVRVLDAEA